MRLLRALAGRLRAPAPFVVGAPRSGTTLLRLMLDAHPDLAIPPETGFLPELAGVASRADALAVITGHPSWPDMQLSRDALARALEGRRPASASGAARRFYRLYAARFGKARWGDKTPGYLEAMDRLEALLPEAHFIHIIRDGRDCALSVRPLWFSPAQDMTGLALDWRRRIERGRALGARARRYLEVRYEALVRDPAPVLRAVCDFVRLDFDPAMLRHHERAAARLDEHEERRAADGSLLLDKAARAAQQRLTREPPRADRAEAWRGAMTPAERAEFEGVAGATLRNLGYEVAP